MVKLALVSMTLLAVAAFAPAQTKMQVKVRDQVVGTSSLSQHILNDGSKVVEMKMEMTAAKQTVTIRTLSNFTEDGTPTRKFQEAIIPGGKYQKQTVATFDDEGANVVILTDGKRETKKVPLKKTSPHSNASEFWFIRDIPKPGDKVKYFAFNMDTLEWEVCTTTYIGPASLKVNGRTVAAHKMKTVKEDVETTIYVDEVGLPLRIESPTVLMTRLP